MGVQGLGFDGSTLADTLEVWGCNVTGFEVRWFDFGRHSRGVGM